MRNASPIRSTVPGIVRVQGVWTGGGSAADCTHDSADMSDGITGLTYNAATGLYLLGFTDVGQQIVQTDINVCGLTTVAPVKAKIIRGSLDAAAKTVEVEFYNSAGSLIDLLTTDKVMITVEMTTIGPNR